MKIGCLHSVISFGYHQTLKYIPMKLILQTRLRIFFRTPAKVANCWRENYQQHNSAFLQKKIKDSLFQYSCLAEKWKEGREGTGMEGKEIDNLFLLTVPTAELKCALKLNINNLTHPT